MGKAPHTVRLLYFAWVRERVGSADERIPLPPDVETVADLVAWLRSRGGGYETAFARPDVVRVAIDRQHVKASAPIGGASEIAFFPPVTGG